MLSNPWRCRGSGRLCDYWEDLADWLNRFLSVLVVLVLGVCSIVYLYLVRPISCQVPSRLTNVPHSYVQESCWTYFMSRQSGMYYQEALWSTPTHLMLSVLGFSIPYVLWQHFAEKLIDSAIRMLMKRLEVALDKLGHEGAALDQATSEAATYVIQCISSSTTSRRGVVSSRIRITQLTFPDRMARSKMRVGIPCLQFFVKLLYLVNAIAQFLFTHFVHTGSMVMYQSHSSNSSLAHLSTCRLNVQSANEELLSCTLTGNLFLRQSYMTFNTWLWFVLATTILMFMLWIGYALILVCRRLYWTQQRVTQARSRLLRNTPHTETDSAFEEGSDEVKEMDRFARLVSQTDAVVLLELIEHRMGSMVVDQVLQKSWHLYTTQFGKSQPVGSKSGEGSKMQNLLFDDS